MKETYYFSHDYNARADQKIKKLIVKFGFLGYGLYWAIIEDLYQNANALRTDYDSIAFDLHSDCDTVKSIVNDFDLFIIEDVFFGSLSVQRRLDERKTKSSKASESANKRWEKEKSDANAMRTQCDSNAIKERKGKERKENINTPDAIASDESKFDFRKSLLELGIDKTLVSDYITHRNKKRASNTKTVFDNLVEQVKLSGVSFTFVLNKIINKNWTGFEAKWLLSGEDAVFIESDKGLKYVETIEKMPIAEWQEKLKSFKVNVEAKMLYCEPMKRYVFWDMLERSQRLFEHAKREFESKGLGSTYLTPATYGKRDR